MATGVEHLGQQQVSVQRYARLLTFIRRDLLECLFCFDKTDFCTAEISLYGWIFGQITLQFTFPDQKQGQGFCKGTGYQCEALENEIQ